MNTFIFPFIGVEMQLLILLFLPLLTTLSCVTRQKLNTGICRTKCNGNVSCRNCGHFKGRAMVLEVTVSCKAVSVLPLVRHNVNKAA